MICSKLEERLPLVVAAMEALLEDEAASAPFRTLARNLIAGAELQARRAFGGYGWVPYIDLAFDVTEAAGGDSGCALPLAAASAFVFSGLDVIDDIADGDTQAQWQDVSPAQQQLAGIAAIAGFPQMLIARLPLPAERLLAMQTLLSKRILLAGAGQQSDLTLAGASEASPDDVEAAVIGKSGEQFALYCEWAAIAAGAANETVAAWGDFGRALGTAGQIRSDLSELCHDEWCRDLASGNRTLPVACHLSRLAREQRADFLRLLDRARTEAGAQSEIRRILLASGAVRMAALIAHLHACRARRALVLAGAREPAKSRLLAQLDSHPAADKPGATAVA